MNNNKVDFVVQESVLMRIAALNFFLLKWLGGIPATTRTGLIKKQRLLSYSDLVNLNLFSCGLEE